VSDYRAIFEKYLHHGMAALSSDERATLRRGLPWRDRLRWKLRRLLEKRDGSP
jgi:hypothetical protein